MRIHILYKPFSMAGNHVYFLILVNFPTGILDPDRHSQYGSGQEGKINPDPELKHWKFFVFSNWPITRKSIVYYYILNACAKRPTWQYARQTPCLLWWRGCRRCPSPQRGLSCPRGGCACQYPCNIRALIHHPNQCWASVTFWYGSADPYRWPTDPAPDPIFEDDN